MNDKKTILNQILASAVEAMGYEYVGCEFHPIPRGTLLRVYIDSVSGIKIEDCEKVSRHLGKVMDVEAPIPGNYTLEVSSPGIGRLLFTLEQYHRFVGQRIKVRTHAPLAGQRNFSGVLQEVTNDEVILKIENELVNLKYINIDKAQLIAEL